MDDTTAEIGDPDTYLNQITRHLPKGKKVKLAKWVRNKDNQGLDRIATLDIMAAAIGADAYDDITYLINENGILMMGLQAWKTHRKQVKEKEQSST